MEPVSACMSVLKVKIERKERVGRVQKEGKRKGKRTDL
jgi:hypothetical protein